jgi:hypothetical protein
MQTQTRNETRDYAWKYFALHADQRLRAFNFYLVIVAVILGGLLAYLKDARTPAYVCQVGLLLAVFSYIFWKMDLRSQEFIKHAEDVLKAIEKDIPAGDVPDELRLFVGEEKKTKDTRGVHGTPSWYPPSWVRGHYGYYACFTAAFWIIGLIGLIIGIGSLFLPGST